MGCGSSSAKVAIAPPEASVEDRASQLRVLIEHSAGENLSAEELRGHLRLAQSILYLMDEPIPRSEGGLSLNERMLMGADGGGFDMLESPRRAETEEEISVRKEARHQSVVNEGHEDEVDRTSPGAAGAGRSVELAAVRARRPRAPPLPAACRVLPPLTRITPPRRRSRRWQRARRRWRRAATSSGRSARLRCAGRRATSSAS
jgi:hypothetical protein